jgi:Mg-chelatase subunit ChlI
LRYCSRPFLIGSITPVEGELPPQLKDCFGLRAAAHGLKDPQLRYQAYQQAVAHHQDPDGFAAAYAEATLALAEEIEHARARLPSVTLSEEARDLGLQLIQRLQIDSSRAEITLFEAARAHAAADEREQVTVEDIQTVAVLALRQRQSPGLVEFFQEQEAEDEKMRAVFEEHADRKA